MEDEDLKETLIEIYNSIRKGEITKDFELRIERFKCELNIHPTQNNEGGLKEK